MHTIFGMDAHNIKEWYSPNNMSEDSLEHRFSSPHHIQRNWIHYLSIHISPQQLGLFSGCVSVKIFEKNHSKIINNTYIILHIHLELIIFKKKKKSIYTRIIK